MSKRLRRVMKLYDLPAVYWKNFTVATTDSRHCLPVFPNLTRKLVVDRLKQVWVADIIYIRLQTGFVYVAAILDRFSRVLLAERCRNVWIDRSV